VIGLDTNILARYYVEEEGADSATQDQRQAARQLIESGQDLFLPKSVALELEWVLRGYYGFAAEQVLQVFEQLLQHPSLEVEDRPALEQALAGLRSGARCQLHGRLTSITLAGPSPQPLPWQGLVRLDAGGVVGG